MSNEMISVSRSALEILLHGERGLAYALARHELRALLAKPAEQPNANFWQWLDSAYRDGSKGEEPRFTKYNMEVAYAAGACAEQPKGEPVAYQFQDRDGKWCGFMNERHYQDTLSDGSWPIRPLYTRPAEQPEPISSESDKYKAELYDEVWQLARDMGFGNVTDALMKLQGNKP